jgi:hypothetical protein
LSQDAAASQDSSVAAAAVAKPRADPLARSVRDTAACRKRNSILDRDA